MAAEVNDYNDENWSYDYNDENWSHDYNDESVPEEHTAIYDPDLLVTAEYYNVHENWIFYTASIVYPVAIFGGVFANTLAFVVLVRGRLWLKHEGYFYLASNFCVNVGSLSFRTSSEWMTSSNKWAHYYPPNTSTFLCTVWYMLMNIFRFVSIWLSVALLFNVHLRDHLIHRRRCGCPMFAAKYCTLFASKIVVGVIFSALFVLCAPSLLIYEIHDGACVSTGHRAFYAVLIVELVLMRVLPFVLFLIILLMALCTNKRGNTLGFSQIEDGAISDDAMRLV